MLAQASKIRLRRLVSLAASAALALGALLLLRASVQAAAAGAAPSQPAVIYAVNTFIDAPDDAPGNFICHNATDGKCSLRAAIQELDADLGLGGTIMLPAGTYTLTNDADGDLQLTKNIFLAGPSAGVAAIQGKPGWAHRILRVQDGADVILSSLAISGGKLLNGNGGGLDVVSGTVLLVDSLVANNQAGNGGGIYNAGALIVDHSTIRSNGAITAGGGLYIAPPVGAGSYLTMNLTQLADNIAGFYGGGLYNQGQAVIMTSTINLNEAMSAGGLLNFISGTLTVESSAIAGNQALSGDGGGIVGAGPAYSLQVANSTVSGNSAAAHGGGIEGFGGVVRLFNVTVVSNTGNTAHSAASGAGGGLYSLAGEFDVVNSLVAQNTDLLGQAPDCFGTFNVIAYDLVQNTKGCPQFDAAPGNITGTDPLLAPLSFYGGPTLTYGLKPGSPAVDAGDPAGCRFGLPQLHADQRGQPRKTDGNGDGIARCDIGAYELQLKQLFLPLARR